MAALEFNKFPENRGANGCNFIKILPCNLCCLVIK